MNSSNLYFECFFWFYNMAHKNEKLFMIIKMLSFFGQSRRMI